MGWSSAERRERYLAKATAEIEDLARRGAVMAGNALSQIMLVKGEPGPAERDGRQLLSGADGTALCAALRALGYAPEDWVGLAAWGANGEPLEAELLREAVCALDPATVVACDDVAADALRETFSEELSLLERFDEAMLAEGVVAQVAGMRMMALGGFEAALADDQEKQVMWSRLKRLPPLGEPY